MSSITWRTETRTLDSLNLRDDNPRYLTDEQEKRLRGSLHKFGYSQLIEVNPDGTVLDGHQRTPLMIAMEEFGAGYEVEVRVPSRALTQEEWREYTALKHQGAAGSFDFEMLKDWGVGNLLEWGFEEVELEAAGFELELPIAQSDMNGEDNENESIPIFPGDIIFPTDNKWGVPSLLPNVQAIGVVAPFNRWGSDARIKRMKGTYHFYTDDYRFNGVWRDPEKLALSQCQAVVEPNFSTNDQMPRAVVLWHIYRKRWLARYWQECGIRVFVDLALAPAHRDLALLGVPQGWRAYATYSYTAGYNEGWVEGDWQQAIEHAGTEEIVFLVYGGEDDFGQQCRERGWLWYPAHQQAVLRNVGGKADGEK